MVLVTIVNSNSKKNIAYKIDKIIETNAELDLPNNNDTVEEKEDIYSSASLGYKGYAKANFYGIDLDEGQKTYLINALEDFSSQEKYKSQIIKKLSKEQDWLLNLALNKYTLKKNETYWVDIIVFPKSYPAEFKVLSMLLTITDFQSNGEFSYDFIAYESTQIENE